jgi:myo-inositol-1(or 4)-monophosphatase
MDCLDDRIVHVARQAARQAVRLAGSIQLAGLCRTLEIEHKGRYDLVTDVDRQSEEAVVNILRQAFGSAGILAEESSPAENDTESLWIIDPLDGTTNYAHGYPAFCSVVALRYKGEIVLGAVYEPLRDELFEAAKGRGATLNGRLIQVSETKQLSQSLLATGFPYDRVEQKDTNLDRFCALTMRTRGVRRGGSAALDLCYTACGRLDGFWEIRLHTWDVSAGALIVEEAGGQITDLAGGAYDYSGLETVATNRHLHAALIKSLADPLPGAPCFG